MFPGAEYLPAIFSLLVVIAIFVLFFRETYPTEVVAIFGVSVFLISGVLPYQEALNVLSNPAPWTISAMFIVMGALVRTGALNAFTVFAEQQAKRDKKRTLAFLIGFVVIASGFVSNTPVVLVMIPVFVQLARSLDIKASKLPIPLSYAAILGGMLTLIGTSINLLLDGVVQAEAFRVLEFSKSRHLRLCWYCGGCCTCVLLHHFCFQTGTAWPLCFPIDQR